ncbi:MAG TPA: hypothetical protein VF158_05565 [Longimicrobiales bacterium]
MRPPARCARARPLFAGTAPLVACYANGYAAEPADAVRVIAGSGCDGDRCSAAVRAADLHDGAVVTRGWTFGTRLAATSLLERLDPIPLAGAVLGTALYTGALDPRATAREFAE